MSTFTRLYFVDRGPGIADEDAERFELPGEEIGSPDLAPEADAAFASEHETRREAALSRLAQFSTRGFR